MLDQRAALILESITDAFLAVDRDWHVTYMNRQAEPLLEKSRDQVLGRNLWEIFPEAVHSPFYQYYHQAVATGQTVIFESFYPPLRRWFSVHAYPSEAGLAVYFTDSTERREREERLRASETNFRVLAEAIPQLVWFTSSSGVTEYFNQHWYTFTGTTAEQNLGRGWIEVLHPDDRPRTLAAWQQAVDSGQPYDIEYRIRRADGAYRWFLARALPLQRDDGSISRWFGTCTDIHDTRQLQDDLRVSESRFRRLFESGIIGILVTDLAGSIHEANDAFLDMVGYSRHEVATGQMQWTAITPPEWVQADQRSVEELEQLGVCVPFEKEYWRKDGQRVPVLVGVALLDATKGLCIAYILDMSARKQAERERDALLARERAARLEAEEAQRRIAFLAESSKILATSLDYRTTLRAIVRLAVPQLADWSIVDLINRDGSINRVEVAHADPVKEPVFAEYQAKYPPRRETNPQLRQVLETGQALLVASVEPVTLNEITQDDHRQQMLRTLALRSFIIVPLRTHDDVVGALSFAYSHDSGRNYTPHDVALFEELANRAALAIDNANLYHAAQEAVRVRDSFLSVAAHELKTPLTTLYGQAQLLERRLPREGVSERNQQSVRSMIEQVKRLNEMIEALLDISRLESGQLAVDQSPVDMAVIVQQAVDEMQLTLSPRHSLFCEGCNAPLTVLGDAMRLTQVFRNLLQNAVKYSPNGGNVWVQLSSNEREVCATVSDEGIGIPQESLPELFRQFHRVQNEATKRIQGVGIGLFVVREIVTLHGGSINVESVEGHGSTFTVCLPRAMERV